MAFFVVNGDGPLVDSVINGQIHLNLIETGVVPSGNTATFNNNINELVVNKYGLIQSIVTGTSDPLNTELFKLHGNNGFINVNGYNNINVLGKNGQINTVLTDGDKNVLLELTNTNVNNQNLYTFELRINNGAFECFDTVLAVWVSTITLIKGKNYIFRQSDVNFPVVVGAQNAIGLKYVGGSSVSNNVGFYINSTGPFTDIQYKEAFDARNVSTTPYIKFHIPVTENNSIELYSQYSNIIVPLSITYNSTIELKRYNNISSITIDDMGRLYDVDSILNGENMVSFNIIDNNNNTNAITNNINMQIKGKVGHIITKNLNANTMEIELEQTNVLNANNQLLEIRIQNSRINVYDSIKLLQTEVNLLKGVTYILDQSNISNQGNNPLSITTSPLTVIEYTTGITYHYTDINNNNIQVSKIDYINSFINNLITNRKIYFTPDSTAPPFLYIYSNNSNIISKLRIIIREDTQLFTNIRTLTIDKFGRVTDILSDIAITNNKIAFELTVGGYSSFDLTQQNQYKFTLSDVLGVTLGNIIILALTSINGSINVNTEIINLAEETSFNIKNIIDTINTYSTVRYNFISEFVSNGLTNIVELSLNSSTVISFIAADEFTNLSFKGNSGNLVSLLGQQTLNVIGNPESVNIVGDNTLKNISVNLTETGVISSTSLTQIFNQNINELTVDKYGRIHNVVTGSSNVVLPISGVVPGIYGPAITGLTVSDSGIVTSVTSGDFQTPIDNEVTRAINVETVLTSQLNAEISRAIDVEGVLVNLNTNNKTSLVNAINNNYESLNTEVARSISVDAGLRLDLNNEIALSFTNSTALTNNLNTERTRAVLVEGFLVNLNSTDKTNLVAAINEIALAISNESNRAINVEGVLNNLNTTNKATLVAAVNENVISALTEQTRATVAETLLTTNLNDEITRATTIQTSLNTKITTIETTFVGGVVWKASYPNTSGLDVLIENNISIGWVYYIVNENRAYIIVDNVNGDYRPSGWSNSGNTARSFVRIADFTDLSNLVATEMTRATNIEIALTNSLNSEITRAINTETVLTGNLSSEITRATTAEGLNTTNLNSEITRAFTADSFNVTNLNNEIARATNVEGTLNSLNTTVKTSLVAATNENILAILSEKSRATAAEVANATNLSDEITRATGVETTYMASIDTEISRAQSVEGVLSDLTTVNKTNLVAAINESVTLNLTEVTRATSVDGILTTNLANEISRATITEGVLSGLNTINKTSLVAATNETVSTISNEITRAIVSEGVNAININSEVTRATTAETALGTLVNVIGSNIVSGVIWQTSFSNVAGLDVLNENNVQVGWVYYISSLNKAYVVVGNITSDYRPVTWVLTSGAAKSFLQIADFSDLAQLVTAEQTRAITAETLLINNLTNETSRATSIEGVLNSLNTANKGSLVAAINESVLSIADEITRAIISENTLTMDLHAETARAIAADGVLSDLNTTNKSSLVDAINELIVLISTEQIRAISVENNNTSGINSEITRATNAEATLTLNLNTERTRATDIEAINTTAINNEILRATGVEGILTSNLNNEIARAAAAEDLNTTSILTEVTRATASDGLHTTLINTEISRATTVEGLLVNLNTIDKTSLVNAINENSIYINDEITRSSSSSSTINAYIDKIGQLTNYSNSNTLISHLGNLNNIPGTPTNVLDYLKFIGDISTYSTSETLLSKIGNISGFTMTLKDIVDAIGDITATYNSSNTLLSNIYTISQVDSLISGLVDSAPGTLDTLNELAAALNDDSSFATNVATLIGTKQSTITGAVSTITSTNLTAGRVLVSNGSGKVVVSPITDSILSLLSSVTSNVQAQLDAKEPNVDSKHNKLINFITNHNNNELYYLKTQMYNKFEINEKINNLLNENNNELYYIKNELFTKDETHIIINSKINNISNINNNNLYYLKNNVFTKDETHIIINSKINNISNINNNNLYYLKNNVYTKNESNKCTDKLINFISNYNHNDIYYTKNELNRLLSKKNDESIINYVSNKNNNELYYLKTQIYNKYEINKKLNNIINELLEQNYDDVYYVKENLYNKSETHDIINSKTNNISNINNNNLYYLKNNVYTKNESDKLTNTLINFISNHNHNDSRKQATLTGAVTTIALSDLTINKALLSNGSGKVGVSAVTSTELGYVSGVTSSIQTQLDAKEPSINLTVNRALLSDVNGNLDVSFVTDTELGYLSGTTSSLQTQINNVSGTTGSIQTQLNAKEPIINLTVNRALLSDASGNLAVSAVTNTELEYLGGTTSPLQTQINNVSGTTSSLQTQINNVSGTTGSLQTQINNVSGDISSLVMIDLLDNNIYKTHSGNSYFPTINTINHTLVQHKYTTWGIKKSVYDFNNIDIDGLWTILIKLRYDGVQEKAYFLFNGSDSGFGTSLQGSSNGSFGMFFDGNDIKTFIGSSTITGDTTTLNASFWTSIIHYIKLKKIISGNIQIQLYASDGVTLLNTSEVVPISNVPFTGNLPISFYINNTNMTYFGYAMSNDDISIPDFENRLNLKSTTLTQYINASKQKITSNWFTLPINNTNISFYNLSNALINNGKIEMVSTEQWGILGSSTGLNLSNEWRIGYKIYYPLDSITHELTFLFNINSTSTEWINGSSMPSAYEFLLKDTGSSVATNITVTNTSPIAPGYLSIEGVTLYVQLTRNSDNHTIIKIFNSEFIEIYTTTITTVITISEDIICTLYASGLEVSGITIEQGNTFTPQDIDVNLAIINGIPGGASSILSNDLTINRALLSDSSGKVGVSTVTNTELGYVSGVTSPIQAQFDAKEPNVNLTVNRALLSDSSGKVGVSTVTNTELSYVSGVTSPIQAQFDAKEPNINLTVNRALLSDVSGKLAVSAITNTELSYLSGVTDAIQTQFGTKQDTLTGGSTTIATNNLTANRVLLSNSSGKVEVSTISNIELGYIQNVTNPIQTQLSNKQATIIGGASTIAISDLTINKALLSNGSGKVDVSAVTSTELGYVSGVTSSIQTQLDAKEPNVNLAVNRALLSDVSGDIAVSAVTNTELEFLSGAASNIQLQINNLSIGSFKYGTSLILSSIPTNDFSFDNVRVTSKDNINIFPTPGENTFTVEFWMNLFQVGGQPNPFWIMNSNSNESNPALITNNNIFLILKMTGGGGLEINGTDTGFSPGNGLWRHYVFQGTYNSTDLTFFTNGTKYNITLNTPAYYFSSYKIGIQCVYKTTFSNLRITNKFLYNPDGTQNPTFLKTSVPNISQQSVHRLVSLYQSVGTGTDIGTEGTKFNVDVHVGDVMNINNEPISYNNFA
jgi:hypothetical protein